MHGRTSEVYHHGRSIFRGLASPITACRYHSLIVERASVPECLEVTAWTDDGTVMALAHRQWPVVGVQFHPESILTDIGFDLLAGFLRLAGLGVAGAVPRIDSERVEPVRRETPLPDVPVTF
jgi:anthranilate synthase/aminodeoxychorismate synthase-like glutamine amidotransferase